MSDLETAWPSERAGMSSSVGVMPGMPPNLNAAVAH
jgi:hypothetical protein